MIRHLTPADYRPMPWANGKGVTVEMFKESFGGAVKWRLSRASVVENGAFSRFDGIERNLTVISGPGFVLQGPSLHLPALPLQPVAFAGDLPVSASGVLAPSDDFNVMTARGLPLPQVSVVQGKAAFDAGALLAVFALTACDVGGLALAPHDLLLTDAACQITGQAIAVRLFG